MRHLSQALIVASLLLVLSASGSSRRETTGDAIETSRPGCGDAVECQKAAKAAFDAEMARVGKDCNKVKTQREENVCQGDAESATERNFAAFYSSLESIVGSGRLRDSQQAWVDYRNRQCDAIFDFWRSGTVAPSAAMRCKIELARSRMRDLDDLYEMPLHH
jgi:uncharacterized protein YecT (DUF1311 family)